MVGGSDANQIIEMYRMGPNRIRTMNRLLRGGVTGQVGTSMLHYALSMHSELCLS